MVLRPDGGGKFETVTLRPKVTIAAGGDEKRAFELHETAHDMCFIAASVNIPVLHEPQIGSTGGSEISPEVDGHRSTSLNAISGRMNDECITQKGRLASGSFGVRRRSLESGGCRPDCRATQSRAAGSSGGRDARKRQMIAAALRENRAASGNGSTAAFALAGTIVPFCSPRSPTIPFRPALLDTLANSSDLSCRTGGDQESEHRDRNPRERLSKGIPSALLTEALAAHRRTPPYIFRELYHPDRDSANLDVWFAGNPATPREILAQIARKSTNTFVIAALLENPKLDCWLQGQLARNLMKEQNRDADNPNVQRLAELVPECTPAPALDGERSVSLP